MIEERNEALKQQIIDANQECTDIEQEFTIIQKNVYRMIRTFKQSKFCLAVANKMPYDENTQFNENNIIQYLAELEEYISSLITYVAVKHEDPNAAISSVPLDKLNQKEFNKNIIAVIQFYF